jgi:carboxylesterase
MLQGAEPYHFAGTNGIGVLLIHGFTGSPSELRELGERLHKKGYTVEGILLKGHGTTPEDLMQVKAEDWLQQVRDAMEALRKTCRKVVALGLSMGGLLAIYAAAFCKADRLILISTPIFLYDWRIHFLWMAMPVTQVLPKRRRHIDAPQKYDVAYRCMPLKGVEQLRRLLKEVRLRWLSKVKIPTLIIQSYLDHTVRPESAEYLQEHITSPECHLVYLQEGKHVLTLYKERFTVYHLVEKFLEEIQ